MSHVIIEKYKIHTNNPYKIFTNFYYILIKKKNNNEIMVLTKTKPLYFWPKKKKPLYLHQQGRKKARKFLTSVTSSLKSLSLLPKIII